MSEAATLETPLVDDLNRNVSKIVRIMLAARGLESKWLAAELGMSAANLANTLAGRRRWSIEDLQTLGRILGCHPGLFFEPADTVVRNR